MNITLRKGTTYISILYKDGDFSNNLYCSNIKYLNEKENILELDFLKITNARIKTDSNDDLERLEKKVENLENISFSDKLITEKLLKRLNQNEDILVRFISKNIFETKMKIIFESNQDFKLEK
ncbi:hypothetical protein [uncultured Lutibacter sp.]|uniref:hypothetical protein n=1 Tax=uncultured Lutibacter sp. TaxID=437739 RepID=UPI00262FDFC2|nr:hypothetical protein [uncultured Lutibacter sp.]